MPLLLKSYGQSAVFHDRRPGDPKLDAIHAKAPVPWTVPSLISAIGLTPVNAFKSREAKPKHPAWKADGLEAAQRMELIGGKDTPFSIAANQIVWGPNWIESDTNYQGHLNAGTIVELGEYDPGSSEVGPEEKAEEPKSETK